MCPVQPRSGHRRPRFGADRRHRTGRRRRGRVGGFPARPAVRGVGGTATRDATGGRARLAGDRSRGARAIGPGRREREGAGGSGMAEDPEIDPGCRPGCGDHQQTPSRIRAIGAAQGLRRSCAAGGGIAGTRRLGGAPTGIGVAALHHLVRLPGGGGPCSCDCARLARCGRLTAVPECVWPRPAPPPGTKHRTATPSPPDPSADPPRVGAAIAACAVATVSP